VPRPCFTPILLRLVFVVLFVLPAFYAMVSDWWWFREIGYEIGFARKLTIRLLFFPRPPTEQSGSPRRRCRQRLIPLRA
jgi:hypothetical protein